MIETPYNAAQATAAIKNPDFGCRQKTGIGSKFASHGLLAICLTWLQAGRPNHHVAGINVPDEARRQARADQTPERAKRKQTAASAPSRVLTRCSASHLTRRARVSGPAS